MTIEKSIPDGSRFRILCTKKDLLYKIGHERIRPARSHGQYKKLYQYPQSI